MNDETRRALWITTAAIIAAQFVLAAFNEHRRLQRWLRDYEATMSGRAGELRERLMAAEGITDGD